MYYSYYEASQNILEATYESDFTKRCRDYIIRDLNFENLTKLILNYENVSFKDQFFVGFTIKELSTNKLISFNINKDAVFLKCNFKNAVIDNILFDFTYFTSCKFKNTKFNNCIFNTSTFFNCDLTNSQFDFNKSEKCSIKFNKCNLENMDMSNNDLSNSILEIKECNTKNAKFNKCVVKELDSNLTFHVEFLLKGGEIKDTNFVNSILTWIGQKIN